jgi:hypothetical protein
VSVAKTIAVGRRVSKEDGESCVGVSTNVEESGAGDWRAVAAGESVCKTCSTPPMQVASSKTIRHKMTPLTRRFAIRFMI